MSPSLAALFPSVATSHTPAIKDRNSARTLRPRCARSGRSMVFSAPNSPSTKPSSSWRRINARVARPSRVARFAGVRTGPRRVRRVMRENGLLAPHRVGRTETKLHDGTIITDKVNEMWGTDMTQTITIREGRANVFVAVEHANSEVVGIHASRSANRFEALEPVRQGVHRC